MINVIYSQSQRNNVSTCNLVSNNINMYNWNKLNEGTVCVYYCNMICIQYNVFELLYSTIQYSVVPFNYSIIIIVSCRKIWGKCITVYEYIYIYYSMNICTDSTDNSFWQFRILYSVLYFLLIVIDYLLFVMMISLSELHK